jgi:hypothetical protein
MQSRLQHLSFRIGHLADAFHEDINFSGGGLYTQESGQLGKGTESLCEASIEIIRP